MLRIIRHTILATTFLFASVGAHASSHQCVNLENLRLIVDEYHLELDLKKPICTEVPGTFTITIKNKDNADHVIEEGDVTVTQKEGSPLTITGNNNDERLELVVNVTGSASSGTDAMFLINVKDVGILDPKVRVVDTDVLMSMLTHAIQETLDRLGLSWEDVARVAEMQLKYTD